MVIDNNTGEVIAASGRNYETKNESRNLAFSSTHPAASLAKVITAASLFENSKVSPKTTLKFNGKGTTLYKFQLKDKTNRWTRRISFERAFNFSNNVVFGKAAIKYLNSQHLFTSAVNFGFNSEITKDLILPRSRFLSAESNYELAEFASGFNKKTTISPLHAAYISYVVARDGFVTPLKIINEIKNESDELLAIEKTSPEQKIPSSVSKKLKKIMISTVHKGTARGLISGFEAKASRKAHDWCKNRLYNGRFPSR